MSNIIPFFYKSHEVRVLEIDGEPWWVAKDVCEVLGLKNPSLALKTLDDDEKGISNIYTPGGNQELTVINEPGLYSMILRSRKPEAKAFKRWLTHEVIPAIRKYGFYDTPSADPEMLRQAADRIEKAERERDEAITVAPR